MNYLLQKSSKLSRSFLLYQRGVLNIRYFSSPGNLNCGRCLENESDVDPLDPKGKVNNGSDRSAMCGVMTSEFVPNGAAPLDVDYATFDRQLEYHIARDIAVADKTRCRHGRCRAFFRFPVSISGAVDSGMVRLSCPYLVQAVDRMEAEGHIQAINKEVKSNPKLEKSFLDTNAVFSKIRNTITSSSERAVVVQHLGQEAAETFFSSGIVGVSPSKVNDIKCMHAHLADGIMRGFDKNLIAARIADLLAERGISIEGGESKHESLTSET
jgi:hypothetical protein